MATKITVNGMTFDHVDDMPPEVRRAYLDVLAHLPEFADRDRDGVPDIVEGEPGPVKMTTSVHKTFIVNGVTYDDEAAMPPDVRETCRQAIRTASGSGRLEQKNEMKMSFQVSSPTEGRLHWLLIFFGACVVAGLLLWRLAGKS